jgi:Excalibur calcium-binding domain
MLPPRNPDPDPEMLALQRRLQAVWKRKERTQLIRRISRWATMPALAGLAALNLYLALLNFSPWPPLVTLRHIAAYPNCSSARAVGLAPARRGAPGYWPHLDVDNDGVACEPWGARNVAVKGSTCRAAASCGCIGEIGDQIRLTAAEEAICCKAALQLV